MDQYHTTVMTFVIRCFILMLDSNRFIFFALMSRKTEALYVKVFEKMQELVPQFSPSSAMADFEEASVCFRVSSRL